MTHRFTARKKFQKLYIIKTYAIYTDDPPHRFY